MGVMTSLEALPVHNGGTRLVILLLRDPSWLPSLLSRLCGSLSRSMTSLVPPLCTGSASKLVMTGIVMLKYIQFVFEKHAHFINNLCVKCWSRNDIINWI